MSDELKKQIIKLRKQGKTYREIGETLECGHGTVARYCRGENLNELKENYTCQYCDNKFKTNAAFTTHEKFCNLNPENIERCKVCDEIINGSGSDYCSVSCANKDRTHSEKTKKKISDSVKKAHEEGSYKYESYRVNKICPVCDEEFSLPKSLSDRTFCDDKCYKKALENLSKYIDTSNMGGYRKESLYSKTCEYNSPIAGEVKLDSTWELEYAKYLDREEKDWIRNKKSFQYRFQGKNKTYTPDFYLKDDDVYVEIKGFVMDKDKAKWRDFPENLKVLKREELENIGCDI